MRLAILIASRNRPDLVDDMVDRLSRQVQVEHETIVVECGTDTDKLSPHSTLRYDDPDFQGKCFGHNLALQYAKLRGPFDYYWVLMNDLVFEQPGDPAKTLIDTMQANPRLAALSPMNTDGGYPQGHAESARQWHPVAVCDYLALMVRAAAVDEVGFLNSAFKYCWGASHEWAFKLYRQGWVTGYCDAVSMKHLGGSTYGATNTKTISRTQYQRQAKQFAHDYFRTHWGENWDEVFWQAAKPYGVEFNTYAYHKDYWAQALTPEQQEQQSGQLDQARQRCGVVPAADKNGTPPATTNAPHAAASLNNPDIAQQANALHPWFYPVQLGGVRVVPGIGSDWNASTLANRVACRQTLLVDQVIDQYDFQDKSLLDLACNCGYWSAHYTQHGVSRVLGVEGRDTFREQAELYWRTGRFLPWGRAKFITGDVADESIWPTIRHHGPFDITLCAGILYHVPNYAQILKWATQVTREAIIIDTRVGDAHEPLIDEPGDLCFNAIETSLQKTVPNLDKLVACIRSLGFEPQVLPATFESPPGLQNVDDYNQRRRVAILARRVRAWVDMSPGSDDDQPLRLHLGCGTDLRPGWVNVDANPENQPDVVAQAQDLGTFDDNTADTIEACHLFEHFTFDQACQALREWHRVLKPGGKLCLELPNLEACIRTLGQHPDPHGYDLGLIGIFGFPPAIAKEGLLQAHKWGWTPQSLTQQLEETGFDAVTTEPITQTWRHAAKIGRDMRLVAVKPTPQPVTRLPHSRPERVKN